MKTHEDWEIAYKPIEDLPLNFRLHKELMDIIWGLMFLQ